MEKEKINNETIFYLAAFGLAVLSLDRVFGLDLMGHDGR